MTIQKMPPYRFEAPPVGAGQAVRTFVPRSSAIARAALLLMLALLSLATTGCVTQFQSRVEAVPRNARVGILLTDRHGFATESNVEKSFVFTALTENGLTPVALNTIELTDIVKGNAVLRVTSYEAASAGADATAAPAATRAPDGAPVKGPAEAPPPAPAKLHPEAGITSNPAVLRSLQGEFQKLRLDYLVLLHADSFGLDTTLYAVVVRVSDLAVVASKFYHKRVNSPVCWPLTAVVGVSALVCPWFFLADTDERTYLMVRDLATLMTQK